MLCKNPLDLSGTLVGCGQCMPCRINKKREWTARLLLEYQQYPWSLFVTLTYSDNTVPISEHGEATLRPEDLRGWLHRLRKAHRHIGQFRYFAVGEYGDKTQRPHYHVVLFGVLPSCEKMINSTWNAGDDLPEGEPRGHTMVGIMNPDRAAYACGYTTKKMTKAGDNRLGSRYPEFTRSSTRKLQGLPGGGIGAVAIPFLATSMQNARGRKMLAKYGDVWRQVRIEGKVYPLSHYMRRLLRARVGIADDPTVRAHQLGQVDYETGEIIDPEPLPEYYGPWHDVATLVTPLRKRVETEEKTLSLPDVIKRAEKVERRYSKTSPTTQEV